MQTCVIDNWEEEAKNKWTKKVKVKANKAKANQIQSFCVNICLREAYLIIREVYGIQISSQLAFALASF